MVYTGGIAGRRLNAVFSEWFSVEQRVKQRCVKSLWLFRLLVVKLEMYCLKDMNVLVFSYANSVVSLNENLNDENQ